MADKKEEERQTSHIAVDVGNSIDANDNELVALNATTNKMLSTENKMMQSITLSTPNTHKNIQRIDTDEAKTDTIPRSNVIPNIEPFQVASDVDKMEDDATKQHKYKNKPCLRCTLNLFGWLLYLFCWLLLFIFCFIFGPILFFVLKSRYIWHNIIWESLIAHTLTKDDALYLLKQFPHPSFFTHCGPSYTASSNILVIAFKILYVIPQSLVCGFYTFWWLLRTNYLSIKSSFAHRTQFEIMVKLFKYLRLSPLGHTWKRTLSSFFFVLDVSTDVIIMLKLYNGEEKYWFSLTFGSILASYFVPWARSITYVKEYIVKSRDKGCYKRMMRNIAGLFLIPWFGIFVIFFVDISLIFNVLFDWIRLLFTGTARRETEEEVSYRRLRTLTELMCESIPQLIIQYYILKTYQSSNEQEKIDSLGLNEFDLYRSMLASGSNMVFQVISLYFESKQYYSSNSDITFFQYLFISMEGKFGLNTKLLSITSNTMSCIDLSNIEFKSDPYLISNFFQATSEAHKAKLNTATTTSQSFVISPRTLNGIGDDMILRLSKHCKTYNIELLIDCNWQKWYKSQLCHDYCLDVMHDKMEPFHTSLTFAITMDGYDGYDYVSRLLKSGCDPNKANRKTDTPLLLSVALKKLDYTKLLLKNGAKVNELNSQNKTSLFHACARREIELIEVLLDHNISVFQQDSQFGNTCLVETGFTSIEIIELILKHENTQKQEGERNEKLVNVANNKGETVLFKAANFKLLNVVQLLVENGANIDVQDFVGDTVLHKVRSVLVLEFLLKAGAQINIENDKQQTALFGAVTRTAYTLLPIYKKHASQINANHQDIEGNTIFHYLAKKKAWKFIYALINYHDFDQINVNLKNKENISLLDMVNEQKHEKGNQSAQYVDFFTKKNAVIKTLPSQKVPLYIA